MSAKIHTKKSGTSNRMPPKLRLIMANDCPNLHEKTKFKFENKEFKMFLVHSDKINDITRNKLLDLFDSLMKEMYEKSSWGYNRDHKIGEFRHSKTRFLILTKFESIDGGQQIFYNKNPDDDEDIVGFLSFRFEVGSDKSEAALYIYELHIVPEYQSQGLGTKLINVTKMIGKILQMDKLMLTVFTQNKRAIKFYQNLDFKPDKSTPAKDEADYVILYHKL